MTSSGVYLINTNSGLFSPEEKGFIITQSLIRRSRTHTNSPEPPCCRQADSRLPFVLHVIEGEPSAASTDDTHTQPFSYSRTNEECEGKKCLELVFVPKGFTVSLYFYFILFLLLLLLQPTIPVLHSRCRSFHVCDVRLSVSFNKP